MITWKRISILLVTIISLASCAAPGASVTPRTMTFPPP